MRKRKRRFLIVLVAALAIGHVVHQQLRAESVKNAWSGRAGLDAGWPGCATLVDWRTAYYGLLDRSTWLVATGTNECLRLALFPAKNRVESDCTSLWIPPEWTTAPSTHGNCWEWRSRGHHWTVLFLDARKRSVAMIHFGDF